MNGDRFGHYVRRNEITRVPRRHIFLDVEANQEATTNGYQQTWRIGVAHFWANERGRRESDRTIVADDPDFLWKEVDAFCRPRARTVLWAHNLAYDVRISRALQILPRLGWVLVGHNLSNGGCWLSWRKPNASLVMVDSASVFPVSMAQVGEHFGIGKPELPAFDGERGLWEARCRADVDILSVAVKAYVRWIESADLGNWQQTGAGQSWATFRHKFMTHKLLVHDDQAALDAERRAMWTGRCEAYWHGALKFQVLHEWDLTLAYARIARDLTVPVRLVGPMPDGYAWRRHLDNPRIAILAEVDVTTDVPVVPALVDGFIAWPVGTFRTTLWGPELRAALQSGATVTVRRGWIYRAEPALRDWADWVIAQLEDRDEETPSWRKVILKHWARALIGRFAMTYTAWETAATAPNLDVRRVHYFDTRDNSDGELLQIGDQLFHKSGTVEWQHSMPAITGYVMSACRVRLWDIMSAVPSKSVLYCDTDSIFTTDRHHDAVKAVADGPIGHGLRLKRSWDGFAIWGPRQIVTGPMVRIAGIPKRARMVSRHAFIGEVWESLETATRRGRSDRVTITPRRWTMKGIDRRRVGAGVGWTRPHRIGETAE